MEHLRRSAPKEIVRNSEFSGCHDHFRDDHSLYNDSAIYCYEENQHKFFPEWSWTTGSKRVHTFNIKAEFTVKILARNACQLQYAFEWFETKNNFLFWCNIQCFIFILHQNKKCFLFQIIQWFDWCSLFQKREMLAICMCTFNLLIITTGKRPIWSKTFIWSI